MTKSLSKFARSIELLSESARYLATGVSSGMRAAARPVPLFFSDGAGSHLTDIDGNKYIDYTLAWGPLILGHSHPAIISAVDAQLRRGQTFGAQHELEISVSKKLCEMIPCADRVVFSTTGTEAVQIAFRLSRAYTGKNKIIRFEGHYHGWLDDVLLGYRPNLNGDDNNPQESSKTEKRNLDKEIVVVPWNDIGQLEAVLKEQGNEVAAIITEAICCNCFCLKPAPNYLSALRDLATRYGVVLIFDEVITGFRAPGNSAQAFYGVTPDLATFGKAVAGGFPLSVVAGKKELMGLIEQRKVSHAGTFNGNPISLAAADATLSILAADQGAATKQIDRLGESLMQGIRSLANQEGIPLLINGIGASFNLSFTTRKQMFNYRDTLDSDASAREKFIDAMVVAGIYLLPDGRWYLSFAHTEDDIARTLEQVASVFASNKSKFVAALTS